jgi:acyl-CoA hydrolase
MGSVNYVGRTSLVVGIKVVAENLQEGVSKHTNTCYFNMVAKSPDGKTAEVPALILKTQDDVRRFLSALQRKRLRTQDNEFMDKYRQDFIYDEASAELLHDQRCRVLLEAQR